MGIAILKAGRVILTLKGATIAELADHILKGYPQYVPDLPSLTAEEHPDDALPPIDPPSAEDLAAAEEKAQFDLVVKKMFRVALNHENRIRVLEGKTAVTAAQFKAALIAL